MLALVLAASAALAPLQVSAGEIARFPELGLELTLPAIELDEQRSESGQRKALWRGELEDCEVEIALIALARAEFHLAEPEDVTELIEENVRGKDEPGFQFRERQLVAGPFGWVPYASLCAGELRAKDGSVAGSILVLGGLQESQAYVLEIRTSPAAGDAIRAPLREVLGKGVRCTGPVRDSKWTDEELGARWSEFSPPDAIEKFEKPVRTEHYVVLSNSPGAKSFSKKMEECYATIRKIYPFDEVAGRRLMPVFLFRTADQYYAYFAKIAEVSLEEAQRSKGHAWRDYYATWYEAPNDPVHIHEGTHQVFASRLRLHGGGSWFQEGVAEYVESRPNDRNEIARIVKEGQHVPLEKFVAIESLIGVEEDVRGGGGASDNYKQAALLIEFLRESEFGKTRFPLFLQRVGRLPEKEPALEETLREIYGVDLAGLDAEFVRYCKKR